MDQLFLNVLEYIRGNTTTAPSHTAFPVTINFHPDHYTSDGLPILEALQKDGRLKSQFETGTSNGGLSAFVGGNRWLWEQRAFAGLYDDCQPQQRPIYGALNITNASVGASPRFGPAHFRLNKDVLQRTSFCYPDSYLNPTDFSTVEGVDKLIELSKASNLDILDNYIEAHIHGGVRLETDVAALVLDPSFMGTEVEKLANTLPCRLEWHYGFALEVSELWQHENYRGREIVELAHTLALDGILKPADLGVTATKGLHEPQAIKKVWHYLAKFGDSQEE